MNDGHDTAVVIEALPLRVHLKTRFRHPAADRTDGESVWVRAGRKGIHGFGEGCPRIYVAGDDLSSSLAMIREWFVDRRVSFFCFEDVTRFVSENDDLIRRFPSAWCAVEMALLDLFARERRESVESLLGLGPGKRWGRYSAVLGDDRTWRTTYLADQYMIRGMADFKVKVNGNLEKDMKKLRIISRLAADHSLGGLRIRLDANNLWAGRTDEAIEHIRALGGNFFAVEEPVAAGDVEGMSRISAETGLPVILDESLLSVEDLDRFDGVLGTFIGNVKLSRVGGFLRAIAIIRRLREKGMGIIVGCHVGETSLLTRAAQILASAAGDSLMAMEGAFGDYLVEWEPVSPMLRFGHGGILDLDSDYYYKTVTGLKHVPATAWAEGLGMEGRMPFDTDDGHPLILYLEMPDGYRIHSRTWGKTSGEDVVFVIHGGMSHSRWQAPLAEAIRNRDSRVTLVAADRRGCGLNAGRGDLGTVKTVIDDVIYHILDLKKHFSRVHLAGWCQGAQYAAIAAAGLGDVVSSLILLTPGFFWNDRFRSVLSISEKMVLGLIRNFDLAPERENACIPIPMEATDFTLDSGWLDFIEKDGLKTTRITMKSASVMDEIQELSWLAMGGVSQPMLMILADHDRIVDNDKVLQFIGHRFGEGSGNRLVCVDSAHAVQFEQAATAASEILAHIRSVSQGGC